MKKLFSVLVISVLVFAACGNGKVFKEEADSVSVSGVLSTQDDSDDRPGTHLVTTENDEVIALRSLRLNLSDKRYLNNDVQLLGFYNEEDEVFEATGISVLEVLNPIDDERLFVPYKNEKLGFHLNYYTYWEITESDDEIVFQAVFNEADAERVVIKREVFEFSSDGSESDLSKVALGEYLGKINPEQDLEKLVYEKIGVDQLEAVELVGDFGFSYLLYRPGYIYTVSFYAENSQTVVENKKVFREMLAEFRFIPIDEAALIDAVDSESGEGKAEAKTIEEEIETPELDMEFTTFESLPYEFKGEYPASWYYAGTAGGGLDVLRHYSFSDEPLSDESNKEELIGLDVISSPIPSGKKIKVGDSEVTIMNEISNYIAYVSVGEQIFRISGAQDYEDIILYMVDHIEALDKSE